MADMKMIVFKLGNEMYGIDIDIVKGIEKIFPVVRIPNSVPYIQGIINLRGDIIPVFSLNKRFNLPDEPETDETKFLITAVGETLLALHVDKVEGIFDIPESDCFETPVVVRTEATSFIKEVALLDKKLLIVLETEELLSGAEKEALKKMVSEQQ